MSVLDLIMRAVVQHDVEVRLFLVSFLGAIAERISDSADCDI